jgi:hypothetical protein
VHKIILAERKFTLSHQLAFAEFSGDMNPIHLSEEYARKTPPGAVIVHGINSFLWALDSFVSRFGGVSSQLSVRFLQPIYLNESVKCCFIPESKVIEISSSSVVFAKVKFVSEIGAWEEEPHSADYSKSSSKCKLNELDLSQIESCGRLDFFETANPIAVPDLYPSLMGHLGPSLVCQLGCLSAVVGMQVPGLHSIFVSAAVDLRQGNDVQFVDIVRTDSRFGLVDLEVQSVGIRSKVRAIVRPKPTVSSTLGHLEKEVDSEFAAGQKVLVIGGSRGLGLCVVKILALAGAKVTFTYSKGEKEAALLKEEMSSRNITVKSIQFDVKQPDLSTLFDEQPSYVFYFATPKIFVKRSKVFEEELFQNFKFFYVDAFQSVLKQCSPNALKGVFYPSTIAVEEATRDLPEYIEAKLQGEAVAKQFGIENCINVLISRLPRTLTDQTATNLSLESQDPVDVMLPILKEFIKLN